MDGQVRDFERTDELTGRGKVQRKRDHRERAFQWSGPPGPAGLREIHGLGFRSTQVFILEDVRIIVEDESAGQAGNVNQ